MLEPRGSLNKSDNVTDLLRIHHADLYEVGMGWPLASAGHAAPA